MHTRYALAKSETTDRLAEAGSTLDHQTHHLISHPRPSAETEADIATAVDDRQVAAVIAIAINTWNQIAGSSHYPFTPDAGHKHPSR